jgi:hypothetical protein
MESAKQPIDDRGAHRCVALHVQSEALPSPATRGRRHVRPARAAGHAAYLTQLLSALASLRSAPSHESPTAKISD